MSEILKLRNITKIYPGVIALDSINLSFKQGEVHALVGENGAGKSTLIKTIAGAIEPTAGELVFDGKEYKCLSPVKARELGIAVVYQEFNLVPVLTASENIFLGEFIKNGWITNKKEMNKRSADLFKKLNIYINPDTKIEDLTTGYQQIVEIVKAISKNAKILIMDEPSAPLTINEVDALFNIINILKNDGVTVIYISHRLDEIFHIADRVSVLRDGKFIATREIDKTDKNELISLMVGRPLNQTFPVRSAVLDKVILEVKNLAGNGVKNISFQLKRGEIIGLGGLVGSGRTEFATLLFGYSKIKSGEIILEGNKIHPKSPQMAIARGIALAPEDRKAQGLILNMTLKENITLPSLKNLISKGFLKKDKELNFANKYVSLLGIKTPSVNQKIKNLSGGNQQKVVLGKWLGMNPEIIILDEPTRGIDVGTKLEIYKLMNDIVNEGRSIIMISSDMEELLGMSDKIVIFNRGRISKILEKEKFSQENVLKHAVEGE